MTKTKDIERAKEQALAQFESIREMLERLKHAQECTEDDCKEGAEGGDTWTDAEGYHDEESARQVIEEDALDIEVSSGYHPPGESPKPDKYTILLCTGGPAVRIRGKLDEYSQPETAEIECQDWFTCWESCDIDDPDDALLTYAQQFYFGE